MSTPRTHNKRSLALSFAAFVSLGLPDGLLGVLWPSVSQDFGIPLGLLPVVSVAAVIGFQIASLSAFKLSRKLGIGRMLALCALVSAASLAGLAVSPVFAVFVVISIGIGLGGGAIDASMNAYAARHFSASMLNWMHAFYGVGATVGPFLAGVVLAAGLGWRLPYLIIAAILGGMAFLFARNRQIWDELSGRAGMDASPTGTVTAANTAEPQAHTAEPQAHTADNAQMRAQTQETGAPQHETIPAREYAGFLLFFVYTGLEVALMTWSFSYYHLGQGQAETPAAMAVGLFGAGFTLGRMLFAIILRRVALGIILYLCVAGIGLTVLLMLLVPGLPSLAVLPLAGMFLAPMFPLFVKATDARVHPSIVDKVVGRQIAAANLGAVGVPAIGGLLVSAYGPESLVWLFAAAAGVLLVLAPTVVRVPRLRGA